LLMERNIPPRVAVRGDPLDGWYILVPGVSFGRYPSHLANLLRGSSDSGLGLFVKGGRRSRKWPLAYRSWLEYKASTEAGDA
ncbi:hypothetical protein AVEN_16860-1, partial [Araneus ventricosus]